MHSPLRGCSHCTPPCRPPEAPVQPQPWRNHFPSARGTVLTISPAPWSLQQADTLYLPGPWPPPQKRPPELQSSRKRGLPARLGLQGSCLWSPSGTSLHAQTWSSLSTQPQDINLRAGTQPRERKTAAASQAPAPAFPRVSWETSFKQQQTAKLRSQERPSCCTWKHFLFTRSVGWQRCQERETIFLLLACGREEEWKLQRVGLVSHWGCWSSQTRLPLALACCVTLGRSQRLSELL